METLLVHGYFTEGPLTKINTKAARWFSQQEPVGSFFLPLGKINTFKPDVGDVMKKALIEMGVSEGNIVRYGAAKSTIDEVRIYNSSLPPDEPRNFLAAGPQIWRLEEIIKREVKGPVGRIISTEEVLRNVGQLELLDKLNNSAQMGWYSQQEKRFRWLMEHFPELTYAVLDYGSRIPFAGDLNYLSYLLYREDFILHGGAR